MTRALWRRLLLLLLVPAALVLTGAGPASSSEAGWGSRGARPGAPSVTPRADRVVVTLTSVSPAVVNRSTPVRFVGTVTAQTEVPLDGARVRVVTDPATLDRREAVTAWASSERPARGRVVAEQVLPPIDAGLTTAFTLDVPAGAISSRRSFAALPVSVEVIPRAGAAPTGVVHTFVAWRVLKEYVPIRVATLLPLTLRPDVDLYSRDDAVRAAAWTEHLGTGSRIDRLLEGSAGGAVTLAVDPSLFGAELLGPTGQGGPTPDATPTTPASPSTPQPTASDPATPAATTSAPAPSTSLTPAPPTTQASPGTPSPTEPDAAGTPDPTSLTQRLTGQLREREVWALPYADADLAATLDIAPQNPLVRDLVERASVVSAVLGRSVRDDVFWPVDGTFTTARDQRLTTLVEGTDIDQVGGVVVSQAAVTVPSPYTPSAVRVTPTGTPLLAFDNGLSALLPARGGSAALSVQQFLADSLVLLGERPGTERSVLLAAPRDYDPDKEGLATLLRAIEAADWLSPVTAGTLLTSPETDPLVQQNPRPAPESIAPAPVLTTRRLAALAEQRDTLLQVATVLRDGPIFEARYREVLDELASVRWRWAPEAWQTLSDSVTADTKAATSAIKVVPQGVNFLAAEGILRITIRNGLDYTIDGIRLVVEPSNPRMTVEQPEPITVGPGALTTVRVPATALAAGRVDIRAYLTTADGTPIGEPAIMRVSANPLDSTFYWAGAVLVGLVLLFGIVRTIRKGTSRVDEIGDLETVAAQVEGRGDGDRS